MFRDIGGVTDVSDTILNDSNWCVQEDSSLNVSCIP